MQCNHKGITIYTSLLFDFFIHVYLFFRELSAKESLFLSKQGESVSTVEKIELMQQEVQRYK